MLNLASVFADWGSFPPLETPNLILTHTLKHNINKSFFDSTGFCSADPCGSYSIKFRAGKQITGLLSGAVRALRCGEAPGLI